MLNQVVHRNRFLALLSVLLCVALLLGLSACSKQNSDTKDDKIIRVGASRGPYSELFENGITPILVNQGYKIEFTNFNELQQADIALSEGKVDLNVDQHTAYMNVFNEERKANLTAITPIPTVPAGLYSKKHKQLTDVMNNQEVGIPNDTSNQARAYNILAKAGWITLRAGVDPVTVTKDDIAENPHNLKITPMDSAFIPRSLDDLDWAVIPGSRAYSSQVDPSLQLLQEDLRPELELVAVVRKDDTNAEWAKAVVAAYRSQEFKDYMAEENHNNYWYIPSSLR